MEIGLRTSLTSPKYTIERICAMVQGSSSGLTVQSMKANGPTIKLMDSAERFIVMDHTTRANGYSVNKTVRVCFIFLMVTSIKVASRMGSMRVTVSNAWAKEVSTRVNSCAAGRMDMDTLSGKMAAGIKDSSLKIKCMDKVPTDGPMQHSTMAIGLTVRCTDRDCSSSKMVDTIKVSS